MSTKAVHISTIVEPNQMKLGFEMTNSCFSILDFSLERYSRFEAWVGVGSVGENRGEVGGVCLGLRGVGTCTLSLTKSGKIATFCLYFIDSSG